MADAGVPTIILCGGRGTRISEVNPLLPKPMLPIGPRPILWHIMKTYAAYGHCDFVLALGHLGDEIRRYFLHFHALTCDFTIELGKPDAIRYLGSPDEHGWQVSCIDTGLDALTGTRVRRASRHLDEGPIMVTYGDCVGSVDVAALLDFHRSHGRLATVTAVRPPGRFGELVVDRTGLVSSFDEKPQTSAGTINGGFMVFERAAIDEFVRPDEDVMLEREPMTRLAQAGQLVAFEHDGFWQPMDTPRERDLLEGLWHAGDPPWARAWQASDLPLAN
ncbi:MAG: glucose-1-phosphate cytidylyltransferase [Actinomycetota bacterium]